MAARSKGIDHLNEIDAVVLETTGDITVIPKLDSSHSLHEKMKNVFHYQESYRQINSPFQLIIQPLLR